MKVQSFINSRQSTEPDFSVTLETDTAIVQVSARLSVLEAVAFKQTCQDLIKANTVLKQIIIAFDNTTFMDNSGLGALSVTLKLLKNKVLRWYCGMLPLR